MTSFCPLFYRGFGPNTVRIPHAILTRPGKPILTFFVQNLFKICSKFVQKGSKNVVFKVQSWSNPRPWPRRMQRRFLAPKSHYFPVIFSNFFKKHALLNISKASPAFLPCKTQPQFHKMLVLTRQGHEKGLFYKNTNAF